MTMPLYSATHKHPDECLPLLKFEYSDGGREDYFSKLQNEEIPYDIQDCAVVAVSLAALFNPEFKSPTLSYRDALSKLEHYNRRIRPWTKRNHRETLKKFIGRRLREMLAEWRSTGIPEHRNPIYGTNTDTISNSLRFYDFSVVFDQPLVTEPFCLCISTGTSVVDGMFGNGEDHAFAVIDGTIVADYDF